jgi:Flp pilus assembly protein TadB
VPLLTKFYGWLAAAGAFVLAVAGAFFYGRQKAKASAKQEVAVAAAEQKANTANAILTRNQVRQHADAEVAALPSNPVGQVTVPDPLPVPGSAADELRKAWSRD